MQPFQQAIKDVVHQNEGVNLEQKPQDTGKIEFNIGNK